MEGQTEMNQSISNTAAMDQEASDKSFKDTIVGLLKIREMAMILLILVSCAIMSVFSPYFLSLANFIAIARGFAMEGLVVVGMTLLLISGNFDLSVGSVMALSGICSAWLMVHLNLPPVLGVLGGVAVGALTGMINGLVVTRIKVNPLIATLGMMAIARSCALGFTSGRPVIGFPWALPGSARAVSPGFRSRS